MSARILCLGLLFMSAAMLMLHAGENEQVFRPIAIAGPRGTLRGQVTLEGPAPQLEDRNRELRQLIEKHHDGKHCLQGSKEEIEQQSWRIDAGGGVANVVVWIRPPPGLFFRLGPNDLSPETGGWPEEVVLEAPHGAFVPHVFTLFPSYYDPETGGQEQTRQVFKIKHGGKIPHLVSVQSPHQRPG
jgi:hypothetical protein